jgi:RecJ-like exonuclease
MAKGKNAHLPYKSCTNCRGTGKVKCKCGGNHDRGMAFGCDVCQNAWGFDAKSVIDNELSGKLPCGRCNGSGQIKRV